MKPTTWHWRAFVWAALLTILILASTVRLYDFGLLPPGLNHDEAAHEIAARELLQTHRFVPFFPINFGLEAGYIYLIAGLFALTGPFAEGGRVVSLLVGLLNIPLTFVMAKELLARFKPGRWATRGALFAAAQTAFTYWYIHYSRIGFEHILVPTTSTLAFWALWWAMSKEHSARMTSGLPWRYVLAGALLGLCLYTYPSARLLPLVPTAQALVLITLWRAQAIRHWREAAVYVAAALLIAAPLLLYFAQNSDQFLSRAGQVAVLAPGALLDGTIKSVGGLFWRGDLNPRLNLPGRPMFDLIQSILLLIGLVALLRQLRQPTSTFILLWAGVMFLPGVLSDFPPHFGRLCGVLPPLVLMISAGAVTAAGWIGSRSKALAWSTLLLAVSITGVWSAHDYVVAWPRVPDLLSTFDTGFRRAAEIIRDLPPDAPVYLSPVDRDYLTIRFVVGEERSQKIKSYNGRQCVVFSNRPMQATHHVIVVAEDTRSLPFLERTFPQGRVIRREKVGRNPYLVVFETPANAEPLLSLAHKQNTVFGGAIRLGGLSFEERVYHPGETLRLEIAWQAATTMQRDYTSFVHVTGANNPKTGNPLWGQQDAQPCDNSYPTTWWSPGEWIVEQRNVTLAPDAPAGDYALSVGWYDLNTGQRLSLDSGGDQATLGLLHIAP